jgi:O-antigen ligase
MKKENTASLPGYFLFSLYIIFFISIVFSLRAISSISIGLIVATGLTRGKGMFNQLFRNKSSFFFLLGCSLFFILQCFSLTYTHNVPEGIKLLQKSSGIIFIPFAIISTSRLLSRESYRKISFYLAVIVCAGLLYCLAVNVLKYFLGAPVSSFFYHDLVKPLSQHAIQFSILVFIVLVLLLEQLKANGSYFMKSLFPSMIIFLSLFLVLLSSKLIICFYVLYLAFFFFRKKVYERKNQVLISVFIAAVILSIITPNPVGNRFRGMFTGKSMLFVREKFSPGIYFNGIQFRLLEWRFTYEILNEQNAWLSGLTPGDAQSFLNKKYRETNMYTGIPGTPDHGYLNYHTHNQFLQSLLENGLPALIIFLFICFSLIKMAGNSRRTELKWLTALLLIYCVTDAPFETQYGIVIFVFFPGFLYVTSHSVLQTGWPLEKPYHPNFIKAKALKQPN